MIKQKMILNSVSMFCSATLFVGAFSLTDILPAQAATSSQLSKVIQNARILAPGTQVKVKIAKDKASISTFRNRKANDKDCKIEAVLIGKTIFEQESNQVNSITVYFYNSRNPSQYKSVSVTKGDVAAFGTGQVSKSELLSSIQIKQGGISDPATAIENQLMLTAASKRADVQIVMGADEINVTTSIARNAPQRELKYEALRIAEIAMAKAGDTSAIKRVKVSFFSPGRKGKFKQITVFTSQMAKMNERLLAALGSMQIVKSTSIASAKDLDAESGPLKEKRAKLIASIQELEKSGVGVAPFVKAYLAIEDQLETADKETLTKSVDSLTNNIEEQIKRSKDAKNRKVAKDTGNNAVTGDSKDFTSGKSIVTPKKKGKVSRWAFGLFPMPASNIVRNPDKFWKQCVEKFNAGNNKGIKAEDSTEHVWALMWFARVLEANERPKMAKKYSALAARATQRLRTKTGRN